MTSVNTNIAAVSALRNLQSTNMALDKTQSAISTGLKIGEAKDNAAYWSISTTLKSDNKALSTVSDALGLGAATVDTAYEAMNAAKDVLDEIKQKLVAASQDGVDKTKIQSEISELQNQLKSIASSATFSGENWLDVDSSLSGYDDIKKVVSSYVRDASGAVTIGTVDIDASSFVLVNRASGKEGILDGGMEGMDSTMTGGLNGVLQTTAVSTSGLSTSTLSAPTATSDASAADSYRVTYKVDGETYTLSVDKATYATYGTAYTAIDGTGVTAIEQATFLHTVLSNNADFLSRASLGASGAAAYTITSDTKGSTSTAELVSASFVTSGTAASVGTLTATGATTGLDAKTTMTTAFGTGNDLTLDENDSLTFDVTVGSDTTRVSVNKAIVDDVLSSTDGVVSSISDFKAVLTQALKIAGLSSVKVSDTGGQVILTGGADSISISNVTTSKGTDLLTFDMSSATTEELTALIASVNTATDRVITAASTLGAVSKRIDLQKDFVTNMMDTIDKGVSGLVDADMNEESTKLQALQVKQQLGVQALSIANQSAQNVLSLFRN